MRLVNIKFGNLKSSLGELIKAYKKALEDTQKLEPFYKKKLHQEIAKKDFHGSDITYHVGDHKALINIVNFLYKDKQIQKYYTEDGLKKIICGEIAKKIIEKGNFDLNTEDIGNISKELQESITNLHVKKFAFQILYMKYQGEDFEVGPCKLTTFDFKTLKVYRFQLDQLIPKFALDFKNFIVVTVYGNDSTMNHKRALELAKNFLAILKMDFTLSPLLELNDPYFISFKDGWAVSYKLTEVLHWNLEIENRERLEHMQLFDDYFNNISKNDLYESLSLSLQRFSYSMKIPVSSFKLSELVGALETLFTLRSDPRKKNSNIPQIIYERIIALTKNFFSKEELKKLLIEYYDKRSEYSHQSSIKEMEREAKTLVGVYGVLVNAYSKEIHKFKSKKEFFNHLDQKRVIEPDKKNKLANFAIFFLNTYLFFISFVMFKNKDIAIAIFTLIFSLLFVFAIFSYFFKSDSQKVYYRIGSYAYKKIFFNIRQNIKDGRKKKKINVQAMIALVLFVFVPLIFFGFLVDGTWTDTQQAGSASLGFGPDKEIKKETSNGVVVLNPYIKLNTIQKFSYFTGKGLDSPTVNICFINNGTTHDKSKIISFDSIVNLDDGTQLEIPFEGKNCFPYDPNREKLEYDWTTTYQRNLSGENVKNIEIGANAINFTRTTFNMPNLMWVFFVLTVSYWTLLIVLITVWNYITKGFNRK